MGPMTEEEYREHEKKMRAKGAVDTILAAEQHKKDKDLHPHIKAEIIEREYLVNGLIYQPRAVAIQPIIAPLLLSRGA